MLAGLSGHLLSASFLEGAVRAADRHDTPARRLFAHAWRGARGLGPSSSLRTLLDAGATPVLSAVGFEPPLDVERIDTVLAATLTTRTQRVLLIVAPWAEPLNVLSHWSFKQALLRSARWCLLFNGTHLRLADAARPYSRRFIQFDLDAVADDEDAFAALLFVVGRLPESLHLLVEESERHGVAVCRSLKDGVLSASADVLKALVRSASPPADSFEQALTIVYRILFLLFAEARGLVPMWHPVYRESYSIAALSNLAGQVNGTGLWAALRAIARLAHAGCRAGDLRVIPFNGRLFSPSGTPLADRRDLDDEAARRALIALTTRASADGDARERIAYRDLGVEQLGTVYETLLDYQPRIRRAAGHREQRPRYEISLDRGSGIRKATGTFYTPLPIAEYLVRRTLGPLVYQASADRILSLRIVDPAMGSGAFLVAACRYLATAYETSLVRSGGCHPSDIGEHERAIIRRTIVERCLYGVDVNPMAVQVARLSLWLATLAADRPLTFLDHHLQAGDSLLGTWVAMLSRTPGRRRAPARRDSTTLRMFDSEPVRGALEAALPIRFSLESIPNDTVEDVRAKEQALARLNRRDTGLSRWKRVADLWCARWLADNGEPVPAAAFSALSDVIISGSGALPPALADRYLQRADEVAGARRLFHWELEFPEVFFGADGHRLENAGFDAVIGNPPWDMIRADAGPAESRERSRTEIAPVLRFARDSGIYTARSKGHANRYQLFTERAMALARHGGRIGLVLPAGLATDQSSAALRRRLLSDCDVDAVVSFDNRRGVFPIHRSVRFQLVTATTGGPTRVIACRPGERDPAALETAGDEPPADSTWFPVRITPGLIHRLSGEDLTIPDFRSQMDVVIAERAASLFPPMGHERSWRARFGRELNATEDRSFFGKPGAGLPVVEGKHVEPFRVRTELARASIARAHARRLLDPSRYAQPRLAYRDVAGAANRLTFIAAILTAHCVSTHTVFCLRTPLPLAAQCFLCGLFNSFVVNYLVRMRVITHVTTATVERLPLPRQSDSPRAFREIAAISRLLFRREDTVAAARLQAIVAGLYQLSTAEFAHVLSTFPLVSKAERDRAYETYVTTQPQK
jgi:Eco57I restriction-modification methylase